MLVMRATGPLLVLALLLGACAGHRLAGALASLDSEAALAVEDLLARGGASRLKGLASEPEVEELRVDATRPFAASLYVPGAAPRAGLVLVPGLHQAGRHLERLVELARTLARLRFLVLVADLPGLRDLTVTEENVQDAIDALAFLRAHRRLPAAAPLGVAGISYAAGPVMLAASDPAIARRVDFVVLLGGYHDLPNVLRYLTTGHVLTPDSEVLARHAPPPHASGKWYYALANSDLIADATDRGQVRDLVLSRLTRRLRWGGNTPPGGLGEDARALLELVTNTDPARVEHLVERLPGAMRRRLRALDLARHDLDCLSAAVMLVHGRHDDVVPFTESEALAARLPAERVHLFVLDALAHVRFDRASLDAGELLPMAEAILELRERRTRDRTPAPARCVAESR